MNPLLGQFINLLGAVLLMLAFAMISQRRVLSLVHLFTLQGAVSLSRIQLGHALGLAADVCAALSASFAYFVVLRISEAQEVKRSAWGRGVGGHLPIDPRDAVA